MNRKTIGDLSKAPEWADMYVERVSDDCFWFLSSTENRWTRFEDYREFTDNDASHFIQDVMERKASFRITYLHPLSLENE